MSIEKRGANTWRIGIQIKGANGLEWVRRTLRYPASMSEAKQRKQAELEEARLKLDADEGRVQPSKGRMTVKQLAEYWMENHVLPECKPTTISGYRSFLSSRIIPDLGDLPLQKLTPARITEWLTAVRTSPRRTTRKSDDQLAHKRSPADMGEMCADEELNKPLSPRTVQHFHSTLNDMLAYAVRLGFIPENPMLKVDRPKAPKARVGYLQEDDTLRLISCLPQEENPVYRISLLLALTCSLRLCEVDALRLQDVDFINGTIDISRALTYTPASGTVIGTPKSDAGCRLIAVPDQLLQMLREEAEWQRQAEQLLGPAWKGTGNIVHGPDGAPLAHDTVSKWFRRFAKRNGFQNITFHDLRHSHATYLLANGIDIQAVSTRLGHSDASTTLRIYSHAMRRRDYDAANVMTGMLSGMPQLQPSSITISGDDASVAEILAALPQEVHVQRTGAPSAHATAPASAPAGSPSATSASALDDDDDPQP